ncbi:hypothetical protein D9M73_266610 [compost metagenome]
MVQGQLQPAIAGSLHAGEGALENHVIAEVDVVEDRSVALEIAGLIGGLHLERAVKFAEHRSSSPNG